MFGIGKDSYKKFFDRTASLLATAGFDGRLGRVNPAWEEQLGLSTASLAGKSFLGLVHPEDRAAAETTWGKVRDGERTARFDARLRCADGAYKWFNTRLTADRESGSINIVSADITARKLTEGALRDSARAMRLFMDQAPVPMAIQTSDGKNEYFNSKYTEVFGYSMQDTPDRATWMAQVFPDAARRAEAEGKFRAAFEKAGNGGEIPPVDCRLTCRDGSIRDTTIIGVMTGGKVLTVFQDRTRGESTLQALRESEAQFRHLMDSAPMAVGILGPGGKVEYLNAKFVHIFGYTVSDVPDLQTWTRLAAPDEETRKEQDAGWAAAAKKAAETGGETENLRFRARCKDGTVKDILVRGTLSGGKFTIIFEDISARVDAEAALRASEATLRKIVDNAPMAMAIVAIDGTIEYINNKAVEVFGYPHSDIPTMERWWLLAYPDEAYRNRVVPNWMGRVMAAWEKKTEIPGDEFLVTCKDGTKKTCFIFGVIAAGKVFVMFDDISARVAAVAALKNSADTLRRIIDIAPVAIGTRNLETGDLEMLNAAFTATFGYTAEDIRSFRDWIRKALPKGPFSGDWGENWKAMSAAMEANGGVFPTAEYEITCKDGSVKTAVLRGVLTPDRKVLGIFEDVTARAKTLRNLRESEEMLRQILNQAPIAIAIQNYDNTIEFINRKFTEYFGYAHGDVPTLESWAKLAYPDEAYRNSLVAGQRPNIEKALRTNGELDPAEVVVTCKDGAKKNVLVTGIVTPDKKIVSLLEDITGRVRAADAIRQSEATLRRILEQAPICIAIHDLDGRVEFANRKFNQMFGYTPQDTPTLEDWARKAYPDEAYRKEIMSAWQEQIAKSAHTGQEMEGLIARIVCRDGPVKTAFATGVVTADRKVMAVFDDITVRTETERALRESESLYRALVETTRTGYVVIDGQGKVRDANKEYVRLTGHSDLKQIMGRSVLDWSAPHNQKEAREAVEIAVRDGRLENYELDYVDKAGRITRVEINATVVTRDGVPQILGLIRDITARSKTEAHLRDSESLYRALVETTRTGYVVVDVQGRVLDANREYVRLAGHSDLKEIVGRRVTEWTAPDLMADNAAAVARCAREGHIFNYETDYIDRKGRRTPIEINATVVRRAGTSQIHALCRDITDRRGQEAELKALNQGLEKRVGERTAELSAANMELTMEIAQRIDAERAREKLQRELLQSQKMEVVGRLAGGIAHDFNNILVAISGYAEFLIKNAAAGSPAREDLNEILRETERGALLTRQLVAISRRQPLQLKVMNINDVVEDTCRMLKRLVGANVHLEPSLAPDLAPVKADPGQVAQIILNLVINARDAMPEGGRITLVTANEEVPAGAAGLPLPPGPGSYAVLTVADTGTGIAPEIAGKIFEPFFTTKPEGKGTGLGLSTVHGIVQQAQGGLLLKSEPGKGASFKLYFPRTADKA